MHLQFLLLFLPWKIRAYALRRFFGFEIHNSARIGFSLVICRAIKLDAGARIGHLTVIKGLTNLNMGNSSRIGNLNWITGFPAGHDRHFVHATDRKVCLEIGAHSAITNRHLIDCTDLVQIGSFSTFAGFRSQILTHSINIERGRQECKPIRIGDYCFVGTNSVLLGGAILPNFSVLGANSVLNKPLSEEYSLYSGNPAKHIKSLNTDAKYFTRTTGFIY